MAPPVLSSSRFWGGAVLCVGLLAATALLSQWVWRAIWQALGLLGSWFLVNSREILAQPAHTRSFWEELKNNRSNQFDLQQLPPAQESDDQRIWMITSDSKRLLGGL